MRKEEGESGTNPEPLSEVETILQEIEEKLKSVKTDLVSISAKESEQQKNDLVLKLCSTLKPNVELMQK